MATYLVTTASDSGDDATTAASLAEDTSDGGGLSLREAVHWVNQASGSNSITFDTGLVNGLIRLQAGSLVLDDINSAGDSVEIDGGGLNITITGDVNADDVLSAGTDLTDIQSSQTNGVLSDNVRILEVRLGVEATIRGLTFTGGYADEPVVDGFRGGAIFSETALNIQDSDFLGNGTNGGNGIGGAVMGERGVVVTGSDFSGNFTFGGNQSSGGALGVFGDATIQDSSFVGNGAIGSNGLGGAVSVANGDAYITGSNFQLNYTTGDFSRGGALAVTGDAGLVVSDSQFVANRTEGYSASGGAVHLNDTTNTSYFTNVDLSQNHTEGDRSRGGAVYSRHSLVITSGRFEANYTQGEQSFGGGVFSSDLMSLTGTDVVGNHTLGFASRGGGLSGLIMNLVNTNVRDNYTTGASSDGGGIFGAQITLTGSNVGSNSTGAAEGGGIFSSNTLTLENSAVYGNATTGDGAEGGGIYASVLEVRDSTIRDNRTEGVGSSGGGAHVRTSATLVDTLVSNNRTLGDEAQGGGLYQQQGTGRIYNSTFESNSTLGTSADGGGIATRTALELTNSTIHNNSTAGDLADGGGLYARSTTLIQNSTITSNVVSGYGGGINPSTGGGIRSASTASGALEVRNSIVAGNLSGYTGFNEINSSSTTVLSGGTLIGEQLRNGSTLVEPNVQISSVFRTVQALGLDTDADGFIDVFGVGAGGGYGGQTTIDILAGSSVDNSGDAALLPADTADLDNDGFTNEALPVDAVGRDRLAFGDLDLGAVQAPEAASNVVTTALDVVDEYDGLTSLREAALAVNNGLVGAAITFENSLDGETLRLTQGEISLQVATTIAGQGVDVTITGDRLGDDVLDANGFTDIDASGVAVLSDNSRIFNAGAYLSVSQLTLTGGVTDGENQGGGAVRGTDTVRLYDMIIAGNGTTGDDAEGGAVRAAGSLIAAYSSFSGNRTLGESSKGGAIFAAGTADVFSSAFLDNKTFGDNASGGALSLTSDAIVSDVTLENNQTHGARAGGGALFGELNLTLSRATLSDNSTFGSYAYGGGVYHVAGTLTATQVDLDGNATHGDGAQGGGLWLGRYASLRDVSITNNQTKGAAADGGGLALNYAATSVNGANVTIAGNSTSGAYSSGGGVSIQSSVFAGSLDLTNATIVNNVVRGAQADGGGIAVTSGYLTLEQSTLAGNVAHGDDARGGGISFGAQSPFSAFNGDVTLINSIVTANLRGGMASGNYFADELESGLNGQLTLGGNNLIGTTASIGGTLLYFDDAGDIFKATTEVMVDVDGDGIRETATGVSTGVLGDNGGNVDTLALKTAGVAFNAGDFSAVRTDRFDLDGDGNTAETLSRDANGAARVFNVSNDLGAVEALAEDGSLIVTTLDDIVDAFDNLTSLREAVIFANAQSGSDTITFDAALDTLGNEVLRLADSAALTVTDELVVDGAGLDLVISGDRGDNDRKITLPFAPSSTDFTDIRTSSAFGSLSDNGVIFRAVGFGDSLTLRSMTLTGGYQNNLGSNYNGGAIYAVGALALEDVSLIGNGAGQFTSRGGAAYSQTTINVQGGRIADNVNFGPGGRGGALAASLVQTNGTVFEDNVLEGTYAKGGAIYGAQGVSVFNSTLTENLIIGSDGDGAGVATNDLGTVLTVNATFENNRASGSNSNGGAIYTATAFVQSSVITGNSSGATTGGAGGIHAGSQLSLINSIVAGNASQRVGEEDWVTPSLLLQGGNIISTNFGTVNLFEGLANLGEAPLDMVFNETREVRIDTNDDGSASVGTGITAGVLDRFPFVGTLVLPPVGVPVISLVQGGPAVDAGNSALLPSDALDLDGDGNVTEALPIDAVGTDRVLGNALDLGAEEAPQIDGTAGDDSITGTDGDDLINGFGGADLIRAGAGNDSIEGGADADALDGGEGDDTIGGGSGNDIIFGAAGADVIYGGSGDDLILPGTGPDSVFGGEGTDTTSFITSTSLTVDLTNPANNTGDATGSTFESIENILGGAEPNTLTGGAADNHLTGGGDNDVLSGGAGNDTLEGAGDADVMSGGLGNDTILVDDAADIVIELSNEGWDRILSEVSFNAPDHIEGLTLLGGQNLSAIAASTGTWVVGNSGENTLTGQQGNDRLDGASGNDTLNGKAGNDILEGGLGNDLFVLDDPAGIDRILDFEQGEDTIDVSGLGARFSDLRFTQSGFDTHLVFSELLTILNDVTAADLEASDFVEAPESLPPVVTGTSGNDNLTEISGPIEIRGLDGDDLLRAFSGSATLVGGDGNDQYYVYEAGTVITELANEGTDLVRTQVDLTLAENVENASVQGSNGINITGNALGNFITGSSGDNVLSGGAGNDRLLGRAGADRLNGGVGNDILQGGMSDGEADVFIFTIGDGVDRIMDFELSIDT
ncbi:MAG: calcium-binding protein, partial [Pseudomonadota bacterium]